MIIRLTGGALALPLLLCAAPALADHGGPEDGTTTGGALDVAGPGTLAKGSLALSLRAALALPQDRSDDELVALAGQHIHAHTSDYVLTTRLGAAFGVTDRLTVSASLPLVARHALREGEHSHAGGAATNTVVPLGNVSGIGDLTLLAKYRLTAGTEAGTGVGIAALGGLKLPTGRTGATSLEGERLETEHQPGTGSWDPVVGLAAGTQAGADRLDASVLYQIAGKGAQDTRLGDRLQAGIAVAHRFGARAHHDDDHAAAHGHAASDVFAALTYEWEGRQTVAGEREEESGGKALWLAPGARHVTAHGLALAGSVAVPLWQDIGLSHPGNRVRLTLALSQAF